MAPNDAQRYCALAIALRAKAKQTQNEEVRSNWENAAESYCKKATKNGKHFCQDEAPREEKLLFWRLSFWETWLVIIGLVIFGFAEYLDSFNLEWLGVKAAAH